MPFSHGGKASFGVRKAKPAIVMYPDNKTKGPPNAKWAESVFGSNLENNKDKNYISR